MAVDGFPTAKNDMPSEGVRARAEALSHLGSYVSAVDTYASEVVSEGPFQIRPHRGIQGASTTGRYDTLDRDVVLGGTTSRCRHIRGIRPACRRHGTFRERIGYMFDRVAAFGDRHVAHRRRRLALACRGGAVGVHERGH
ncbi:hypothetical protein OG332_45995 [Streptomyces sp. NBC_01233]|nr:hypothetical protein OG332_45995 [Streptomyces sp. NBC_01233]